jgi:hypothetical protein
MTDGSEEGKTDMTDVVDRPDLSDRAIAMGAYLGRKPGGFEPFGPGYQLLGEWLRTEILCNDLDRIGHDGVDLVTALLGEDFPLAASVRELWKAAGALSLLCEEDAPSSVEIHLGDQAITWGHATENDLVKRTVRIDSSRPVPGGMRRWFERAGIYQSKAYGIHRRWRTHNYIDGASRRPRFAAGTRDGVRHFRVLPHLDRMDACDGCFDRWANSTAASVPMPRTQAEFEAALDRLVELASPRVVRPIPEAA